MRKAIMYIPPRRQKMVLKKDAIWMAYLSFVTGCLTGILITGAFTWKSF